MTRKSSIPVRAPFSKIFNTTDNFEDNIHDANFISNGVIIVNIGTNDALVSFFDEEKDQWIDMEAPIVANQVYTFYNMNIRKMRFKNAVLGSSTSIHLWIW